MAVQFAPITDSRFNASPPLQPSEKPLQLSRSYEWRDPASLPPREWLFGRTYLRGIISAVIAPGGVGKSSLLTAEALSMATGKPLIGQPVHGGRPLRVWLWNGEDPAEELEKKIAAHMLHFDLTQADIGDRLFFDSGHDTPLKIAVAAEKGGGFIIDPQAAAHIEQNIRANKIDVALFDPFVSLHSVDENNNGAIDMLAKELAKIATKTRCAIGLAHHARKASAGSSGETKVDDSRGASALVSAARVARTLNVMQPEEAARVGVDEGRRFFHFRSDDGKANLAPRSAEKATWYRLESVSLGNGNGERPADEIGVVTPWAMPGLLDQVSVSDLLEIQKRLHAEPWRADAQSKDWGGQVVADVLGLDATDKADKAKIKQLLATWTKSGALKKEMQMSKDHKRRSFFTVGEWTNS
jgi:hypothetical protein